MTIASNGTIERVSLYHITLREDIGFPYAGTKKSFKNDFVSPARSLSILHSLKICFASPIYIATYSSPYVPHYFSASENLSENCNEIGKGAKLRLFSSLSGSSYAEESSSLSSDI